MKTIDQISRIVRLHELIKAEHTGTSTDLSLKLKISLRQIQYDLDELRDYGADISFDHKRNTYYFKNNFSITFFLDIKVSACNNSTGAM